MWLIAYDFSLHCDILNNKKEGKIRFLKKQINKTKQKYTL